MKPAEGSTVIGKSVIIRGELSGSEELYIDGDVEGTITLPDSRVTIGPNARIRADLNASEVVIFGKLTGNIHSSGRVDLRQSAQVQGDILAGRLSIEDSAFMTGKVELKIGDAAKPSTPAATSTAPAPATAAAAPVPTNASLFPQPKV